MNDGVFYDPIMGSRADRSIDVNKNLIKLTVKLAGRLSSFIYFLDKIFWS